MPDPRHVFLFSGHMIDGRDRASPRFPPQMESSASAAIAASLDEFGAGREDLGITEGACGGDLLFAEAMLERGASLDLHLPFQEHEFLANSVDFDKPAAAIPDHWRERYFAVRRNERTRVRIMSDELGPLPADADPYERCNLWMLEDALAFGPRKVRFICLWNGRGGDGPGGTEHLRREVKRRGGQERWLDTSKL